jgi:hypothetical protein
MTYTALLCRLILDESKSEAFERRSVYASMDGKNGELPASWTDSSRKTGAR